MNYSPISIKNTNSANSVSFQSRNHIVKEIFKPTYIEPKAVQILADEFSSKIIKLYEENKLSVKSVRTLVKEVAPDLRVKCKKIKLSSDDESVVDGYMYQKNFLGLKNTKIFFHFGYLKTKNNEVKQGAVNTVVHEFTHVLRYNTKSGNANIKATRKNNKYSQLYNLSQDMFVDNRIWDKWEQSSSEEKALGMLDKILNYCLKKSEIVDKKEKIKTLQYLYYDTLSEAEAYKNGDIAQFITEKYKPASDPGYQYLNINEEFAHVVKNRYLKEGGDPKKLKF